MNYSRVIRTGLSISISVLIIALFLLGSGRPVTAQTGTAVATSAATLDPAGLDASTLTTFKSKDGAMEFQAPAGWNTLLNVPNLTWVEYGRGTSSFTFFVVGIGSPKDLLVLPADVDSPKAALFSWIKNTAAKQGNTSISDPFPVTLVNYNGLGISSTFEIGDQKRPGKGELWVIWLGANKAAVLLLEADASVWKRAQPILHKMANSLILRPENVQTWTPVPPTITPDLFSVSTPTTFKSSDDAFEISLAAGWERHYGEESRTSYTFEIGSATDQYSNLLVLIGKTKDIYPNIGIPNVGIPSTSSDPQVALQALRDAWRKSYLIQGDIYPVKIGTLDGFGMTIPDIMLAATYQPSRAATPTLTPSPEELRRGEFWMASLGNDRVLIVVLVSTTTAWSTARPVMYRMAQSLAVHPEYIPTATSIPVQTGTPSKK